VTLAHSVRAVIGVGRVQTPTLAIVCRRELDITRFVPQTYFETAIGRYKHLIGLPLRTRHLQVPAPTPIHSRVVANRILRQPEATAPILPGQQGEVALAVHVLSRMIRVAKSNSVRIA
jgi:hypothetical protein